MRSCGVRFAIDGPRRACRTAEPECFDTLRVADRPAAHAGSKLHKVNPNRRGERPRFIATLRIGHEPRGAPLITADPAFRCRLFNSAPDFGHFAFATFLLGVVSTLASDQSTAATFSLHTNIILWTMRLRVAGLWLCWSSLRINNDMHSFFGGVPAWKMILRREMLQIAIIKPSGTCRAKNVAIRIELNPRLNRPTPPSKLAVICRVVTISLGRTAPRTPSTSLARTLTAQAEAPKRYRSGGEQKMAVQHLHVAKVGQAIVGNVSATARGVSVARAIPSMFLRSVQEEVARAFGSLRHTCRPRP